jgi:hypothetical protein
LTIGELVKTSGDFGRDVYEFPVATDGALGAVVMYLLEAVRVTYGAE